jgi:DNA-binding NtrC family response regulator
MAEVAGESGAGERRLHVLFTPDARLRERIVPIGERLTVGRVCEGDVALAIDDKLLSRRHATFARVTSFGDDAEPITNVRDAIADTLQPAAARQRYDLCDHDSRNGSFVDGQRVDGRRPLRDGCIVRLGVTLLELTEDREEERGLGDSGDAITLEGDALVGGSLALRRALARLEAVARESTPVLVGGEQGTGKELAARRLHRQSGRRGRVVVADCGSLPSGEEHAFLFGRATNGAERARDDQRGSVALAERGTLILDDVAELPATVQPAVLELVRTGRYRPVGATADCSSDARIVAVTSQPAARMLRDGALLPELYERLARTRIDIPPLRARRSDIPLMARRFLAGFAPGRRFEWSATCLEKLLVYEWPLNVRELRAVAQRLALLEEDVVTLRSAHLPKEIRRHFPNLDAEALRASAITVHAVPSREELVALLDRFGGSVSRLARHYLKDRRLIMRWLKRHDLLGPSIRD